MRIIAGTYRSRILKSLKGHALRPTSDILRETLFNVLGPAMQGARFLDIYAGTGAVGIEAISRGAADAVFIENHAAAAKLIARNLELLDIRSGATILQTDAIRGLEKISARWKAGDTPFQFIFLDPPYAEKAEYDRVLRFLGKAPFLGAASLVIAEHHRDASLPENVSHLGRARVLKQGDAALTFYIWNSEPHSDTPSSA